MRPSRPGRRNISTCLVSLTISSDRWRRLRPRQRTLAMTTARAPAMPAGGRRRKRRRSASAGRRRRRRGRGDRLGRCHVSSKRPRGRSVGRCLGSSPDGWWPSAGSKAPCSPAVRGVSLPRHVPVHCALETLACTLQNKPSPPPEPVDPHPPSPLPALCARTRVGTRASSLLLKRHAPTNRYAQFFRDCLTETVDTAPFGPVSALGLF